MALLSVTPASGNGVGPPCSKSQSGEAPCYYNYGKNVPPGGEEPEPVQQQDQVPAGAGSLGGRGKLGTGSRPDPGWLTAPHESAIMEFEGPHIHVETTGQSL